MDSDYEYDDGNLKMDPDFKPKVEFSFQWSETKSEPHPIKMNLVI